jgi:dihydroorotate dehydrogenase electron transfer subunit
MTAEVVMQDVEAQLRLNRTVADDFYQARLYAPSIADRAKPGQFVEVQVNAGTDPFLRLPLSICAVDTAAGTVDVLYEAVGPKSRALSDVAVGASLALMGPLGKRGFSPPASGRRAVLVGGGIGIPPLLFFGKSLLDSGYAEEVVLLAGARNAGKHLSDDLMRPSASRWERCSDDGSMGHKGLVTDLLSTELDGADCEVFTCGPHPMMAAVAALCSARDVACQASLEEYMACGYGVCVGCVIEVRPSGGGEAPAYEKYSRVCVDGPVFDAHRVNWGGE